MDGSVTTATSLGYYDEFSDDGSNVFRLNTPEQLIKDPKPKAKTKPPKPPKPEPPNTLNFSLKWSKKTKSKAPKGFSPIIEAKQPPGGGGGKVSDHSSKSSSSHEVMVDDADGYQGTPSPEQPEKHTPGIIHDRALSS